jgi:hypothetical protein
MTSGGPSAWRAVAAAALSLLAGGCGAPLFGDPTPPPKRAPGEAGVVLERAIVFDAGGGLDWCHASNRIAFDRSARTGVSEVFTIDPFGQDERCLTCDMSGLPKGLRGSPSWHPSCKWLVIQVANRHAKNGRYEQLAWGIHHDLWAIAADGSWAEPLVATGSLGASLSPQISRDGTKLAWSVRRTTGRRIPQKAGQRTPGAENPWEGWHLAVAKLEVGKPGRPRLGPIAAHLKGAAGGGRFEADALVGDTLWFSRSARAAPYVDDVFRLNLAGGAPENLTRSPGVWDDGAKPSPGGQVFAYVSSAAFDWRHPPDLANSLRLELFVQDRAGKRSRISSLNNALEMEGKDGRALAGDHAWGPRGKEIALAYAVFTTDGMLSRRIDVIELDAFH